MDVTEQQAQFERNMIELCKGAEINRGTLQTSPWTVGQLRQARQPVKRKPTAAAAASTAAGTGRGRKAKVLNADGGIASVCVKQEPK